MLECLGLMAVQPFDSASLERFPQRGIHGLRERGIFARGSRLVPDGPHWRIRLGHQRPQPAERGIEAGPARYRHRFGKFRESKCQVHVVVFAFSLLSTLAQSSGAGQPF